jgi:alkylated DNA nucleotide flippase Atl1
MKVVFRKFKEGDVIALFCNSAKDCRHGNVMSYQHVGQHGEASRQLGRNLKLATPEEYAPLLRELRAIYAPETIDPVSRLVA